MQSTCSKRERGWSVVAKFIGELSKPMSQSVADLKYHYAAYIVLGIRSGVCSTGEILLHIFWGIGYSRPSAPHHPHSSPVWWEGTSAAPFPTHLEQPNPLVLPSAPCLHTHTGLAWLQVPQVPRQPFFCFPSQPSPLVKLITLGIRLSTCLDRHLIDAECHCVFLQNSEYLEAPQWVHCSVQRYLCAQFENCLYLVQDSICIEYSLFARPSVQGRGSKQGKKYATNWLENWAGWRIGLADLLG